MNRMYYCSILLVLAICVTVRSAALCLSDQENTVTLVTAQYRETGKQPHKRMHADYVLYRFSGGELIGTESILQTDNAMRSQPTLWKSVVCGNRYAVSSRGEVVDTITKKRLFQISVNESVLAFDDDRLTVYCRHPEEEIGCYTYVFETGRRERCELLSSPWLLSPDRTLGVAWHEEFVSAVPYLRSRTRGIWLATSDGQETLLAPGFHPNVQLSPLSSTLLARPPLLWLDNSSILTQRGNGKLVAFHTNGSIRPIVAIPIHEKPISNPTLRRDSEGRIIYTCGKAYVIEAQSGGWAEQQWEKLGNGFDVTVESPAEPSWHAYVLRYMEKEIGRGNVSRHRSAPKAYPGYLAAIFGAENCVWQMRELRVWNVHAEKWITIRRGRIEIIGWINESRAAEGSLNM